MGGRRLLYWISDLCWKIIFTLVILITLLAFYNPAGAAPVPVRFAEGVLRGYLILTTSDGERIASGDLFQVSRDGEVKSRTLFHFKDGSTLDESAVFTQHRFFTMKRYRAVHKGPAFAEDIEIDLDRESGKYHVRTKAHKSGEEKVLKGTLDLPLDVYNGIVAIITKNLTERTTTAIHMVAFTPSPKVIELDIVPSGEQQVLVGELRKTAIHYILKPKLGIGLKLLAQLFGRVPPDSHLWIVTGEVPGFARFEGPFYLNGPMWRIELTGPRWPK